MLTIDWGKVDLSLKIQKELHLYSLLLLKAKRDLLLESMKQGSVEFLVQLIFNIDDVQWFFQANVPGYYQGVLHPRFSCFSHV